MSYRNLYAYYADHVEHPRRLHDLHKLQKRLAASVIQVDWYIRKCCLHTHCHFTIIGLAISDFIMVLVEFVIGHGSLRFTRCIDFDYYGFHNKSLKTLPDLAPKYSSSTNTPMCKEHRLSSVAYTCFISPAGIPGFGTHFNFFSRPITLLLIDMNGLSWAMMICWEWGCDLR